MKKGILIISLLLFGLASGISYAQDVKVKSFQRLERDLLARTEGRVDLNDDPCGVLRVSVAKTKNFFFEGNIIGDVVYKPGEAIVYLTQGSRNITIKSEDFGILKYDFPERIEKQVVYKLDLKLILSDEQKIRTLVMPVAGVGSVMSYGAMIGVVKKTGAYLKVKYNFVSQNTDYECDADGRIEGEGGASWFTGDDKISRFAITGGLLQRLWKPFYLYVGGGYGYKTVAWEMDTENNPWAENTDKTYKGYEVELGGIFRIKNIALSAGVQSNQLKYWEATVGVGIMF